MQNGQHQSGQGQNGQGQEAVEFGPELETKVAEIISRYPKKKSAIMPALYMAQEHIGWLTDAAIEWVAEKVEESPAHVRSVATFYTMYYKKPVGQYHLQICRTLSCMLCGARDLTAYIKDRLTVDAQVITEDGLWSFEEVECLGSCGSAPMIQINDVFFENLSVESLGSLMDKIAKEKPDLRYSAKKETLGEGMPEAPRSQAWNAEMVKFNKS